MMIPDVRNRFSSAACEAANGMLWQVDFVWHRIKSVAKAGKASVIIETDRGRYVRRKNDMLMLAYDWSGQ